MHPGSQGWASRESRYGLVFLAIFLLFAGLVAYEIVTTRSVAHQSAVTQATNLTLVLESRIHAQLYAAARTLQLIGDTLDPDVMDTCLVGHHEVSMDECLAVHLEQHPIASTLRVFDANGEQLYGDPGSAQPLDIAQSEYFGRLREQPGTSMVFSRVGKEDLEGPPAMWGARSIRSPDGSFLGALVLSVELAEIHRQFGMLELGKHGVVVLRRMDDGAVVVRWPGPIMVDNPPDPEIPTRKALLTHGPAGVIDILSPVDGFNRIYAYREIHDFPFLVAVGLASKDYLAVWRQNSLMLLLLSLVFITALIAVFMALLRGKRRRDQFEMALVRSEARFRSLINENNSLILQINPSSGAILAANAAACRFYGWSPEVFHTKCFQDFCLAPAGEVLTGLQSVVQGQSACQIHQQRLANGDIRTVEVHSTPIPMNEGPILVSIIHDVSERRRLEQELNQQNLLLNTVLANLDAHIYMKDREGRFLYANQAVSDFLG